MMFESTKHEERVAEREKLKKAAREKLDEEKRLGEARLAVAKRECEFATSDADDAFETREHDLSMAFASRMLLQLAALWLAFTEERTTAAAVALASTCNDYAARSLEMFGATIDDRWLVMARLHNEGERGHAVITGRIWSLMTTDTKLVESTAHAMAAIRSGARATLTTRLLELEVEVERALTQVRGPANEAHLAIVLCSPTTAMIGARLQAYRAELKRTSNETAAIVASKNKPARAFAQKMIDLVKGGAK